MKLLIVDDQDINLRLLRAQLEAEGHAVIEARNGVEALQRLDQENVDGVISDILMPQMDGYRLCLEVRKNPRHGKLPFVLYTSTFNSEGDRTLARAAGADDFILKPAPTQVVLDAIRAAAASPGARGPDDATVASQSPLLTLYNETLVRKLEEKHLDLERAHEELRVVAVRRKQTQQRLLEAQRIGRIGDWELDLSTRRLNWSPQVFAMRQRDPALGPPSLDESMADLDAGSRELAKRRLDEVAATMQAQSFELSLRLPDGTLAIHSIIAEPVVGADGRVSRLRGTVQDITDKHLAEQALRREQELLRLVVEHSPAAIAMFDRDMRYIVTSRRYLSDYNVADQELTGLCHYQVFPQIPEHWKQVHQRVLAGATESAEEDRFPRGNGAFDWVRWEMLPWREADGNIGGILLFCEVITERKQAEQRVREAALGQQALARRLVEVQEIAQRKLSIELHDRIGQSLTALSLNLNIIGNGGASAPDDAKAQRLRESQTLLQETMTSVRNLISELRPVVLDEYGLLAGLRWYAQEVQRRAGLEILVRGEEPELRLPAKIENALFRIAQEAVNNVLKHAQAKRIDLSLECVGHGVRLGVEDNGKGFETARVGDLARHEHWGLEMMAERAEAVGARFRVESTVGRGTRIMVTLGSAWDR